MAPRHAPDSEEVLKVLRAACSGNIKLFKRVAKQLDDGKGLARTVAEAKDVNKRGALFFAAHQGKLELCKYLVEKLKIDVNEQDVDGQTPLLHAARNGQTATVRYLIEKGADPATPSAKGPALHNAAGNGHIECVKLLLSKGVDIDLQSHGRTALMWAASLGREDAVKVLLEHHANVHPKTDNLLPLASAVAANSLPCVELLVKAGAKVYVRTSEATPLLRDDEATLLFNAADNGNAEIINCLLQAGADPNIIDEHGNKPIQVAATRGNRAAVEALLAVTPRIQCVPEWSVDGVIEFMQYEYRRKQLDGVVEYMHSYYNSHPLERTEAGIKANKSREPIIPKKDLPEVTPEAKKKAADANARGEEEFKKKVADAKTRGEEEFQKKAADAKARGEEAFKKKDFAMAVGYYTQAIDFDPTDGTLFSNRSLCWIRLGQAEHALCDAKACRKLRPDWAKACYREGAALHLLQRFEEAANVFCEGLQIDPESKELITAFRESIEADRRFHGTNKKNLSSSKS